MRITYQWGNIYEISHDRSWLDGKETELFALYPHAELMQLLLLGNAGPMGTVSFARTAE